MEDATNWSSQQYSKFEAERNRPIRDLLAQVPYDDVATIADLGCGPGNSTELIFNRFPNAAIIGMDSSFDMLEAASRRLPSIRFEIGDIATWPEPGPLDLIVANASLQWVPNHAALLRFLFRKLSPRGALAVQVPDNLDEPAHRLMRETAAAGPWSNKLADASRARASRHSADWYYRELTRLGADANVWRTTYYHPLSCGPAAIAEWFQGTGLRPFLQPLSEQERQDFLSRYIASLAKEYPVVAGETVLLPFPRLFFVASQKVD